MIWANCVEALQSLLEVCKNFLQCYCCYYGFNTAISIFNTANSLGNVCIAIILYKVRHTDWVTAENEQLVPCYMWKSHAKIFFSSLFFGGGFFCCLMLPFGQFLLHVQFQHNSFPCISRVQNLTGVIFHLMSLRKISQLFLHPDTKNPP